MSSAMSSIVNNAPSTEIISDTELTVIASRINALSAEAIFMRGRSIRLMAKIGEYLALVKRCLPSGTFMVWVQKNCQIKHAQVNRYMRLAEKSADIDIPETLSLNAGLEFINSKPDVQGLVREAVSDGETVHHETIRGLNDRTPYPDDRKTPSLKVVHAVSTLPRTETWQFVPHLCVVCLGRILMRRVGKRTEYICAECEHRVTSNEPPCWCHKTLGDPAQGGFPTTVKANRKHPDKIFECIQNPDKSVVTNAIVVREKAYSYIADEHRPNPAFTGNKMDYL